MRRVNQEHQKFDWLKWAIYAVVVGVIGGLFVPLFAKAEELALLPIKQEATQGVIIGGVLCDHAEELIEMFQAMKDTGDSEAFRPIFQKYYYTPNAEGAHTCIPMPPQPWRHNFTGFFIHLKDVPTGEGKTASIYVAEVSDTKRIFYLSLTENGFNGLYPAKKPRDS